MERKDCSRCGTPNLETEVRCWACGSTRFGPGGSGAGEDERTCVVGSGSEPTLSWHRASPLRSQLFVAAGVLALALFCGSVGYWIGRASHPAEDQISASGGGAEHGPIALPPPPTHADAPRADPAPDSPPPVTIRSRRPPPAGAPPATGPPAALVYGTRTPAPSGVRVLEPAPPAPANPSLSPSPRPGPVSLAPSGTQAVLSVRNDDAAPVEVELEGSEGTTLLVAPGGTVPVALKPGTYTLQALGRGAVSTRSRLAVAASRSYSLVIDRRKEAEGRDILVVVEPAVDGQPG